RDGWIDYFGVNDVAQLAHGNRQGLATVALQLLDRFHVTYRQAGAFKDMSHGDVTLLLGRLDMEVGRVLLAKEGFLGVDTALARVGFKHDAELRSRLSKDRLASLPEALPTVEEPPSPPVSTALLPRVIEFSPAGLPLTQQQEHVVPPEETRVEDWASSLGGEAFEFERLRAAFFARLGAVAAAVPVVDSGTLLLRRCGAAATVTAAVPIPTGTLLLFPLVPSIQSLVADSQHPGRLATGVSTPRGHLYVNPCVRYPGGPGRPHNAGSTEVLGFMPPCWAIRRSQTEAEANCLFGTLPVELVTSIAAG
ncbi:MAG: hypothetical protein GY772_19155, partial [bacterium]|nr:hypothetical protein [bacterium]